MLREAYWPYVENLGHKICVLETSIVSNQSGQQLNPASIK